MAKKKAAKKKTARAAKKKTAQKKTARAAKKKKTTAKSAKSAKKKKTTAKSAKSAKKKKTTAKSAKSAKKKKTTAKSAKKKKTTAKSAKSAKKKTTAKNAKSAKKKTTAKSAKKKKATKKKAAKKKKKKKTVLFVPEPAQRSRDRERRDEPRQTAWPCEGRSPARNRAVRERLEPPLAIAWQAPLPAAPASAPVVSSEGVVYLGDRDGGLHAFAGESGELIDTLYTDRVRQTSEAWPLVEAGLVPADQVPVSTAPAVWRWNLFFGDDEGIFYAVRRGEELQVQWRKGARLELASRQHGAAYQAPLVADDHVYTLDAEGSLHCVEARSGRAAFSLYLPRGRPTAPPALFGRRLLAVTEPRFRGESHQLHAFHAKTGERAWRVDLKARPGALSASSELALVASPEGVAAYGLHKGDARWARPLEGVAGGLALDSLRAFVPLAREVVALDVRSGEERWRRDLDRDLTPGAAPLWAGGVLWVAAARSLVALDAGTGRVRGKVRLAGEAVGGPVAGAGHLLVALDSGELRALR